MRYSGRAQSVIQFANQEAARLGHDHISTGHLLLGLIREGEGSAVTFLEKANIDLEEMKAGLEGIMENKGRGSAIGKLQLTSRANDTLKLAAEESESMGHKYVGTEHLLVGLIHEREGVASKILAKFGIDLDKVRSAAQTTAVDEEEHSETLTFNSVEMTVQEQEPYATHPPFASEKEALSLEEASQLLQITVDDLNELLKAEDLPARILGGQWRFSRSALLQWLGEGKSRSYLKGD